MPSAIQDAKYWRGRATEAGAQAEQMPDPEAKRQLLEIAAAYERLAKLAGEEIVAETIANSSHLQADDHNSP